MPEEPVPQIPWAPQVKVDYVGGHLVGMELGNVNATLHSDGGIVILRNSRKEIAEHMTLDEGMTHAVRRYFDTRPRHGQLKFGTIREEWLRDEGPHWGDVPYRGQKWFDAYGKVGLKELGTYGSKNTYNFDQDKWEGDVFEFTDFELEDGRAGAVIQWQVTAEDPRSGQSYSQPEVWIGDFDRFIDSQYGYEADFQSWNDYFDNGFVWALDMMGMFDEPEGLPENALDALVANPDLLWPEAVEKLSRNMDQPNVSDEVRDIVQAWRSNRAREAEKATGQKYIWPKLFRKGR